MYYYRGPAPYDGSRFFFGAPLLGGFVGGLLGGGLATAFLRPRPYPYPVPYPYPGGGVPYGAGVPYGYGGPYGYY